MKDQKDMPLFPANKRGCRPLARGFASAVLGASLCFFSLSVGAQTPFVDPFSMDQQNWVSLDSYKPKEEPAPEPTPAAPPEPAVPKSAEPVKAEPERPLNPPGMPQRAVQPSLTVSSTEDAKEPLIKEDRGWRNFQEDQKEVVEEERAEQFLQSLGKDGFKVRFPGLPSAEIKSIPAERISKSKLDRENKTAKKKEAEKPKPTVEACEALNELKRRQLEAIESDRKTLAALQEALKELGLSEKLNFMTPSTSSLAVGSNDAGVDSTSVNTP